MNKQLLLVRHAHSDQGNFYTVDSQRLLSPAGEAEAEEMAGRLFKKNAVPQQFISSPALRAIRTAEYFSNSLGHNPNLIIQDEEIYEALTYNLMSIVNNLDNSVDFVALFGHNPSITGLVNLLCNTNYHNMPPATTVLIRFSFDSWNMVSSGKGEVVFYDYPGR